jgi:ribosome-associated translation inhibitor RaiA
MLQVQISFRGLAPSEAIEARIRHKIGRLNRFAHHVISCRVVVEALHDQRAGRLFQVLVDVVVPGHQIVLSRGAEEDVDVALRNAFDSAQREMVEDWTERIRGSRRPVPAIG